MSSSKAEKLKMVTIDDRVTLEKNESNSDEAKLIARMTTKLI